MTDKPASLAPPAALEPTPLAPVPASPPVADPNSPCPAPSGPSQVTCVATPVAGRPSSNIVLANTDRMAVASLVCGLTAIVPVVSQVAGIVLGVWSLVRIRRVRRAGGVAGGTWAAGTGIGFSAAVLISWVFVIAAMYWAGSVFDFIGSQLPTGAAQR